MIYLVISIGLLLIVFSYFQEKKSKTLFKEIFEEEKSKPPIRLVNNTYEEIEYQHEITEMKERIAKLQRQNIGIVSKQKSIVKYNDSIDDDCVQEMEEMSVATNGSFDVDKQEESFLDTLASESGVRKGDLLLLKKS